MKRRTKTKTEIAPDRPPIHDADVLRVLQQKGPRLCSEIGRALDDPDGSRITSIMCSLERRGLVYRKGAHRPKEGGTYRKIWALTPKASPNMLDLRPEPGEQQVSAYFRKSTGPEGQDDSVGVVLRCKGGNKAVTALIDELNKAVPGDAE